MSIARRVAQRRVALLLLPLRVWMGLAWLRSGLSKVLQPEWWDGSALTGLVGGQVEAGTAPLSLYPDLLASLAERAATPMGIALACGELAIGLGLLTGTLTNLALLMAIALNVNFILAGVPTPSQYYVAIEVVLLAGGAGAAYSVDRGLSRYMSSAVLTGHRGLVDGVEMSRSALVALGVAAGGLAVVAVPTVGALLPDRGVDDAGFVLVGLLLLVAVFAVSLTRATHRADDAQPARIRMDDPLGVGFPHGAPTSVPPPGRPLPPRPPVGDPVSIPPRGRPAAPRPRIDDALPLPPPRGRPVDPRRAPAPPRRPAEQWPAPAPLAAPMAATGARPAPALRDQPTTQFARQRRRRVADRPLDDPYAELRDLPPNYR